MPLIMNDKAFERLKKMLKKTENNCEKCDEDMDI